MKNAMRRLTAMLLALMICLTGAAFAEAAGIEIDWNARYRFAELESQLKQINETYDAITAMLVITLIYGGTVLAGIEDDMARLRKAIDDANSCKYSADCPVLQRMRFSPKDRDGGKRGTGVRDYPHGQRDSPGHRQRKRGVGGTDGAGEGADVGSEPDDSDGQPP